jgi:hypothetical protein
LRRRPAWALVAAAGWATLLVSACSSATPQTASNKATKPASKSHPIATSTTTTVPLDFHRPLAHARPLRVLVVGDSVGESFGRGLVQWAHQTRKATVLDESREWCSLGRYLPRNAFGPQNSAAGCDDWGTRWAAAVRTFDPDVVFVMYSIWEVIPRKLPGATDYSRPGNPALDAWQLSEYRKATDVLSARGARVVWFSIACEGGTTIKRGEPLWYVNRRTIPALARSRSSVRLIDLDGFLCNRKHELTDLGGVHDIRPDHAHYSEAGALALARWVMPIVLGRTRPPPYASN